MSLSVPLEKKIVGVERSDTTVAQPKTKQTFCPLYRHPRTVMYVFINRLQIDAIHEES